MTKTVLFLCPHNAAKSVIAVAYFQQLANARGLDWRADSAGTEPASSVYPTVVQLMSAEGFDVRAQQPRLVAAEDLLSAACIVSMGCDVTQLPTGKAILRWDDLPAVSEQPFAARDAIRARVEQLVGELAHSTP